MIHQNQNLSKNNNTRIYSNESSVKETQNTKYS
jgi:hypothetical protein